MIRRTLIGLLAVIWLILLGLSLWLWLAVMLAEGIPDAGWQELRLPLGLQIICLGLGLLIYMLGLYQFPEDIWWRRLSHFPLWAQLALVALAGVFTMYMRFGGPFPHNLVRW